MHNPYENEVEAQEPKNPDDLRCYDWVFLFPVGQYKAVKDIIGERDRQDNKWGRLQAGCFDARHLFEWLAILTEEVGELSEEMLDSTRNGVYTSNLRTEAVQVAAVALAIVEQIDRNQNNDV